MIQAGLIDKESLFRCMCPGQGRFLDYAQQPPMNLESSCIETEVLDEEKCNLIAHFLVACIEGGIFEGEIQSLATSLASSCRSWWLGSALPRRDI